MVRLDVDAGHKFRQSILLTLVCCGLFLFFQPYLIGFFGSGVELDTVGIIAVGVVFAILLILIIAFIILNYKKAKNKIKESTSSVWRTTEGIFNLEEPMSVVEALVLYQDYTSQSIHKDLRKDDFYITLLFNIFEKVGWAKYEDGNLYLRKDIENKYYKRFCYEPIAKSIESIKLAEELLDQDYCKRDFEKEDLVFFEPVSLKDGMTGQIEVYYLETIADYGRKLKGSIKKNAQGMINGASNWFEIGRRMNTTTAGFFSGYASQIGRPVLDSAEVLADCEWQVKEKYFLGENKREESGGPSIDLPDGLGNTTSVQWGGKITLVAFLFTIMFIAILFGVYALVDLTYPPLSAAAICIPGAWILSSFATYSIALRNEANEKLTPRGQEIVERIAGLKNFIANYTQLKNPVSDNIYKIWDEFVLFAYLFNVNSNLYEVARDNGQQFENQSVVDYFESNKGADALIRTNHSVCQHISYPVLKHKVGSLTDTYWTIVTTK